MSPQRLLAPARRLLTNGALVLVVGAIFGGLAVGSGLLFAANRRSQDLAAITHAIVQQAVNARYADCVAGDALRRGLYEQVRTAARSDALLYRLLPSLNTPQVHRLVAHNRAKELRAFAPRGRTGCAAYALRAAPTRIRRLYRVPR